MIKIRPRYLFYGLSLMGFIFSFILIMKSDGEALKPLYYYYDDYCADFYNQILYVQDPQHVYQSSPFAAFPPFAFILYYILGKFIAPSVVTGEGGHGLRDNLLGMNLYVIYTLVLTVLFIFMVQRFTECMKKGEQLGLLLLILLSAPFVGMFERGNSVYMVLILLFLFLYWKDSKVFWKREMALLILAAAAAMKLYPAVFGLLYLREKRFKEAVRLTLYGILLVFAPFPFFGGIEGIKTLLYNFRYITAGAMLGGDLRSVAYLTALVGDYFGLPEAVTFAYGEKIAWIFFAVSVFCAVLQKEIWKQLILLAGIMIFFPSWSGSYTLIYLALPLVIFLADKKMKKTQELKVLPTDWSYEILFACVFTLVLWNPDWSMKIFHSEFPYTIRILGAWGLVLHVMIDTVYEKISNTMMKKRI